jgi:S-adenosylmethionine/arginine decarboxylase-like enzyme
LLKGQCPKYIGDALMSSVTAMPLTMEIGGRFASQAEFDSSQAWGLATSIDMQGCDPDTIRSHDAIAAFTTTACDRLGVTPYGSPQIVRFGASQEIYGYSMVQLIETSLVSGHFAESTNAVYLDIFSCKWYDAAAAVDFAMEFFKGTSVRIHTCLRR